MFEYIDQMNPIQNPDYLRDFPPVRVFSQKGSFRWWWWMFMFKEDGARKQLVAFWTSKTYPDVTVNGRDWGPADELTGSPEDFTYKGMSTFWYWDGKEFHETPPRVSAFHNKRDENGGIKISSDDVHHFHDRDNFTLSFCRDSQDFDLKVEEMRPNTPKVGYKRTLITKNMGFDALELYNGQFTGSLTTKGHHRQIKGSLYMQNITLNTPALPWVWGVFHKDDGGFLNYFSSLIGPLMFVRKSSIKHWMDNRFKCIKGKLHYTPVGEEMKRFGELKYRVVRAENGLPGFEVSGVLGKESLRLKVRTLAKTTYCFERKKFWQNKFFYNEFPSELTELVYTDADGVEHEEDVSQWTGNSEYSWGLYLS